MSRFIIHGTARAAKAEEEFTFSLILIFVHSSRENIWTLANASESMRLEIVSGERFTPASSGFRVFGREKFSCRSSAVTCRVKWARLILFIAIRFFVCFLDFAFFRIKLASFQRLDTAIEKTTGGL